MTDDLVTPIPKEEKGTEKTAEEIKKENDALEAELLRRENLRAKLKLGGQSEAGLVPPKPKEESPIEYVERLTGRKR